MDDVRDLVLAAAAGDAEAWRELVDRFADLVWAVARSVGLSGEDAADVSQTTWLRFCEHLGRLQDPARAGAWLAVTARHEAIRVSKLGVRQLVVDPWALLSQPEADPAGPGVDLMDRERDITVQCALAVLPPRCRAVLLATTEDPPAKYEDVARRLGLAVNSIGPTRRRCLERLRQVVSRISPDILAEAGQAGVGS